MSTKRLNGDDPGADLGLFCASLFVREASGKNPRDWNSGLMFKECTIEDAKEELRRVLNDPSPKFITMREATRRMMCGASTVDFIEKYGALTTYRPGDRRQRLVYLPDVERQERINLQWGIRSGGRP